MRLIGLIKQAVKKTLCRAFVSLQELETVTEIEAMLNDRPPTYVSYDISDPEPLTPAHGRRIQSVPHTLYLMIQMNLMIPVTLVIRT